MSDLFSLTGQRALITGSSQGIGYALATGLIEAGAKVVLNGRDATKLERAAEVLGEGVETLVFDATDHEAVRAAVDGFEAKVGPIDILVNNAGMQHRTELENFPADAFEKLLQTNVASVFHVGQAVARHMIARGAGKIINIASVQTALARPGIAPYTATKGAVGNLTKGMATDWAKHGAAVQRNCAGIFRHPVECGSGRGSGIFRMVGEAHTRRGVGGMLKSWWGPVCSCRQGLRALSMAIRFMSMAESRRRFDRPLCIDGRFGVRKVLSRAATVAGLRDRFHRRRRFAPSGQHHKDGAGRTSD